MLRSLTIENFAIIDKVQIDFTQGMTVLSGETGAGKSIIIDALSLLCGGRGSSDFIRQGSDKLLVEGLFDLSQSASAIAEILTQFGIDVDFLTEDCIIRREINQAGKNTIRINGQLTNVATLKEIGPLLADIHGQNEHQELLDKQKHLNLLDAYDSQEILPILTSFQRANAEYQEKVLAYLNLLQQDTDQEQRLAFLEFQIQEIEAAQLVDGEDQELMGLSKKMQSMQTIQQNAQEIAYLLGESDTSILIQFNKVLALLDEIKEYDNQYTAVYHQLLEVEYELTDYTHQLASLSVSMEETQSLDEIENRLGELSALKRKYKMDINEIIDYYQKISEEVYQINHRDRALENLQIEIKESYQTVKTLADQLSQTRKNIAARLIQDIQHELQDLYMGDSQFEVQFQTGGWDSRLQDLELESMMKFNSLGYDDIEFYVSTNKGEPLKPLINVASGGELSRFMLALKTVFNRASSGKIMVFDEIDTGVSGRVAQAIAEKIKEISAKNQVLCITHLPQVAAVADQQIYIRKRVNDNRTVTEASILTTQERGEVIAQMISGKEITKTSLEMANELLKQFGNQ